MGNIEKVLNFIVEIEKLKGVLRKTQPVGLDRYENSAEHSWHVCISALMLKDYADDEINIDRVIKMLLLHDLGEIDAGDTIVYAAETAENKANEASGINRLLNILPAEQAKDYIELWHEFELGVTADSVYAKAIDRVPPLLHNIHGEGHSWKAHNISKEQVFSVNSRIGKGSKQLWTSLEQKLEKAVSQGLLK
ncbi:HD domain-containing protein [Moritella sp. 5]|uniref:HD domain-containing protein n=1 Tax=Moritella sp. 5 TaxID=2746231 RepID=UPI001BAC8C8C|nr:HD domain-containing protein [Moritella sp. 5]QUM81258.1 HD domain-containing protein [Moritella sp. 5]